MTIIGWILIVVAALWLIYKVYLAYQSSGGRMVVTVYDAAVYPPLMVAAGLFWVLPTFGVNLSIWIYIGIAAGLVILAAGCIKIAEEIGDRPL